MMEEDEEVDILGEYDVFTSNNERAISNISSGQILSCEYTVHPRWLSDSSDAAELWPENMPQQSSQDEMEMIQDEVVIEEPAPIDFDWCEEEEYSNHTDIILEQDIPTIFEEEVVDDEGTTDDSIYAYEDPEPSVPQTIERKLSPKKYVSNSRSLLKSNALKLDETQIKPKTEHQQSEPVTISSKIPLHSNAGSSKGSNVVVPKKSKTMVKAFNYRDVQQFIKLSKLARKKRLKSSQSSNDAKLTNPIKKHQELKAMGLVTTNKRFIDIHGENITINHEVNADGEHTHRTVINENQNFVQSNSDNSDQEIDIVSDDDPLKKSPIIVNSIKIQPVKCKTPPPKPCSQQQSPKKQQQQQSAIEFTEKNAKEMVIPFTLKVQMDSLEPPGEELRLNVNIVTDLEKFFHAQFFEGRPTKTPERYMKIRRFILNAWNESKPTYVGKTFVRNGLKNCGDVNCISRIHTLLEQIGAINFGHSDNHFDYVRPLHKLYELFASPNPQKSLESGFNLADGLKMERRQRCMKQIDETDKHVDMNYTVSHAETISMVVRPSLNDYDDDDDENHVRQKYIKPEFQLVKCRKFNEQKVAPFHVSITLSTLLCLQFHSLSATHEVMGFIGGHRTVAASDSKRNNKLHLTRYKPCKTSEQNATMCEMCPVSQVEQSVSLISEGYELLGWFHSHPTFPPQPSRRDVATQKEMQHQFSMIDEHRPFVGLILGCIDMSFRCVYIMPEDMHQGNQFDTDDYDEETEKCIPFEVNVDVVDDLSNFVRDIKDVLNMIDRNSSTYSDIYRRFSISSKEIVKQFGYDDSVLSYLLNLDIF